MDKAQFNIALAEIIEEPRQDDNYLHPYLTTSKFIFADDKGAPLSTAPSGLMQGIEFEDFDEVIKTSIHMPIKMFYTGHGAGNHLGSYVIGHITDMQKAKAEDGTNQLIAEAVLYAEEFPEEVAHLKKVYAEGKPPGISYEMIYGDSIIKNGVQWLKKVVTTAATFVRDPAYGKRTAMLALASAADDTEVIPTLKAFIAQAEAVTQQDDPKLNDKGGTNVEKEELEKAQKEAADAKALAETRTAEVSRLTEELEAVKAENETLKGTIQKAEAERKLEVRVRRLSDAGFPLEADAEKATKTQNFVVALDDDAFDTYLENLESVKKAAAAAIPSAGAGAAFASLTRTSGIPRPEVVEETSELPVFRFRQ